MWLSHLLLLIMEKHSKIFVSGHRGLVGSALVRNLKQNGYTNIVTISKNDLDLTDQYKVDLFFKDKKPEYVFSSC